MSPKSKHDPANAPAEPIRIRHRDTGGVRVVTAEQWRKDRETLREQGFVLVDADDIEVPDESG